VHEHPQLLPQMIEWQIHAGREDEGWPEADHGEHPGPKEKAA
jgi:hypothetical protein